MDLVACLRQFLQERKPLEAFSLKQALREAVCTVERVAPYIPIPDPSLGYGRKVIYHSPQYEAVVIHLPENSSTPVHDHGVSVCCAYVVSGTLINRVYAHEKKLVIKQETMHLPGEFMFSGKGQIHSMHNPGKERLISVHLYTPPIQNNRIYSSWIGRESEIFSQSSGS